MTFEPLAERLRPKSLDEYIGQKHLVGEGCILRKMIESGHISSFILWGPPGVGKTTLAKIIASQVQAPFYTLSAVHSGVKDVRDVLTLCKRDASSMFSQHRPILFIDEIHRFNKSQQDSLLAAVETGTATLIGATTENPSFEIIRPLLSRAQVYVLKPLTDTDLNELLHRAITCDSELKQRKVEVVETDALFRFAGGDARKMLNILDLLSQSVGDDEPIVVRNDIVTERLQQNPMAYDKGGEMHYDIVSAFIKSIRGSNPDAAVYWLARMIAGGEDPAFIARRLVISAAEDIGLANPNALLLANATFDALQTHNPLGMCRVSRHIAQKQLCIQRHQRGAGFCRPNGQPACAAASAQRSDKTDERDGLRRRLQISALLSRKFCGTGLSAARNQRQKVLERLPKSAGSKNDGKNGCFME